MLILSLFLTETPTSSACHLSDSPSPITHLPPEVVLVYQVHRPHGLDHLSTTFLAYVAFPLSTSTYTPTVHHPVLLPLQNQKNHYRSHRTCCAIMPTPWRGLVLLPRGEGNAAEMMLSAASLPSLRFSGYPLGSLLSGEVQKRNASIPAAARLFPLLNLNEYPRGSLPPGELT
jgi:hypothetical protein